MGRLDLLFVVDYLAYLEDRDGRKQTDEKEDQQTKESKRPGVCRPVPPGRDVYAPRGWKEVAMQAGDNDHKALQPHTHVDDDGNDPHQSEVAAHFAAPQRLRDRDIEQNQ